MNEEAVSGGGGAGRPPGHHAEVLVLRGDSYLSGSYCLKGKGKEVRQGDGSN